MKKESAGRKVGGVSANALTMPIVVVLAILHITIISVILMINKSSASLSTLMQNAGIYTQEATSLLAGSSLLSETSTNFVLMPETEAGEVNVGPLTAYAQELAVDRRGDAVVARFESYDVPDEARALIVEAADCANAMLEAQLHAIELMRSVYPLPETGPLSAIPRVELTEEELAMTDAQKTAAARVLVLGSVYGMNKSTVSQSVNACVEQMQANSGRLSAMAQRRVGMLRQILWIVTLVIVFILIATFATLYSQILRPLGRFVRLIPEDSPLDEQRGFREVRMVASAYNEVLNRRNALDDILRSAAETDALTNLPNRYRFEQYMLESQDEDCSVAVLLFDVNYLKKTNDTEGHLAGDALIRAAGECIAECFGSESGGNCFRFGGDEFAAVVKNCTPESLRFMVRRFEETQKKRGVSISMGYAYAEELGKTDLRALLDEADKYMYAQKKIAHGQNPA